MKRIYVYILAALLQVSHSCDEFLTESPESFVAPDNLFTTQDGAIAAVNGVYASMNSYRNGKTALLGNIGTDEAQIGIDERSQAASTGVDDYGSNLNPANTIVNSFWNASYFVISRANLVVERTPTVDNMSEELKNRVIAEARFLRATAYLNLVTRFGDIPISETSDVKKDNPRRPATEVYALIFGDLSFAEQHLPDKGAYSSGDAGRATRQAAEVMHAKALMAAPETQRDFSQAAQKLKSVIDFSAANPGVLGLEGDYTSLFAPDYENGLESIFEIQFLRPDQTNDLSVRYGSRYNGMTDVTIPGSGYADGRPTDYIFSIFADDDLRKPVTFRTEFFTATGALVTTAANPEYLKPHVKKFEDPLAATQTRAGRNIIYLRYADVLLMYSEALLQTGGGDPLPYINAVRERAGQDPLMALTLDDILEERARELAFEGWRWFDLKRTDKLVSYTEARHPYATDIPVEKTIYPIPLTEISTNLGIDLDDQNPGY